jgi:Protein of unknown function (DUF4238)
MAGIRHHILPRFLLRGFESKTIDGKVFAWVYSKKHSHREMSTKDISVEKYFYGREGELSIDPEITEIEPEFADLLNDLREKLEEVEEVSDPRIARFITHLCTRTKHLRDSVCESIEFLNEYLDEYFSDFENIKKRALNDPHTMETLFRAYNVSPQQRETFIPLFSGIIANHLDKHKVAFERLSEEHFLKVKQSLTNELKDGHIRALSQNLLPAKRIEKYNLLRWFICDSTIPLILGDVGCLFEISGNRYRSLDDKEDEIRNIFLPISSNKILLGTSSNRKPKINFKHFRRIYAEHSREYFVCSKNSREMKSLSFYLGNKAEMLTKEEKKQVAESVFLAASVNYKKSTLNEIQSSLFSFI